MVEDGDIFRDVCMFCYHLCAIYCYFLTHCNRLISSCTPYMISVNSANGKFFGSEIWDRRHSCKVFMTQRDRRIKCTWTNRTRLPAPVVVRRAAWDWVEGCRAPQGSFFTGGQRRIVPGVGFNSLGWNRSSPPWRRSGTSGEPCLPPPTDSGVILGLFLGRRPAPTTSPQPVCAPPAGDRNSLVNSPTDKLFLCR